MKITVIFLLTLPALNAVPVGNHDASKNQISIL